MENASDRIKIKCINRWAWSMSGKYGVVRSCALLLVRLFLKFLTTC